MSHLARFLLALILTSPLHAEVVDDLLAALRTAKPKYTAYDDRTGSPENFIKRQITTDAAAATITKEVQSHFALSETAAALLVEAAVRSVYMSRFQNAVDRQEEVERIGRLLRSAASGQPKNVWVLGEYAKHVSSYLPDDFTTTILPMIRRQDDPTGATWAILDRLMILGHREVLLADALRRNPGDMRVRKHLAVRSYRPEITVAVGPVAVGAAPTMRGEWREQTDEDVAAAAAHQIRAFTELARAADALAVFDTVRAGVQALLNRGGLGDAKAPVPDVRLDVALAAWLIDDHARCRSIVDQYSPPSKPDPYDPSGEIARVSQGVLSYLLAASNEDPFDLLVDVIQKARMRPGLWSQAVTELARRGGHARLASRLLDQVNSRTLGRSQAVDYFPPAIAEEMRRVRSGHDAYVAKVTAQARALAPASSTVSAAKIAALLRAPRIAAAAERPLPPSTRKVEAIDCKDRGACGRQWRVPISLYPLRMERDGESLVAVGGMLAEGKYKYGIEGSYWVGRSADGGKSWEGPYFTGLRRNAPYVLAEVSDVPMSDGESLYLEAQVREMDFAQRGGWLVVPGREFKREGGPVLLELPWRTITRDSDADGLTDLLEEVLVLDPHDRDTDADGVIDGDDFIPHVPQNSVSPWTKPLEAALKALTYGPRQVMFISGDRGNFLGVQSSRRLIILTPEEWKLFEQKFRREHPADVSYTIVSRDATRAFVVLNHGGSEDQILLAQENGEWKVVRRGGWIS